MQYKMTSMRMHAICQECACRKGAGRPSARSIPVNGSVAGSCYYTSHGGHMQNQHWAFLCLSNASYSHMFSWQTCHFVSILCLIEPGNCTCQGLLLCEAATSLSSRSCQNFPWDSQLAVLHTAAAPTSNAPKICPSGAPSSAGNVSVAAGHNPPRDLGLSPWHVL